MPYLTNDEIGLLSHVLQLPNLSSDIRATAAELLAAHMQAMKQVVMARNPPPVAAVVQPVEVEHPNPQVHVVDHSGVST